MNHTDNYRYFCGECGSHLFVVNEKNPDFISVVYNNITLTQSKLAVGNLFLQSKKDWVPIDTTVKCFDRFPSDDEWRKYAERWLE